MEEYLRTLSILLLLELLCSYLRFNNGLRDSILLQLDVANSNLVSLIWNLKPFLLDFPFCQSFTVSYSRLLLFQTIFFPWRVWNSGVQLHSLERTWSKFPNKLSKVLKICVVYFLKMKIGDTKSAWRYYLINSLNYALFSYIKHLHVHC